MSYVNNPDAGDDGDEASRSQVQSPASGIDAAAWHADAMRAWVCSRNSFHVDLSDCPNQRYDQMGEKSLDTFRGCSSKYTLSFGVAPANFNAHMRKIQTYIVHHSIMLRVAISAPNAQNCIAVSTSAWIGGCALPINFTNAACVSAINTAIGYAIDEDNSVLLESLHSPVAIKLQPIYQPLNTDSDSDDSDYEGASPKDICVFPGLVLMAERMHGNRVEFYVVPDQPVYDMQIVRVAAVSYYDSKHFYSHPMYRSTGQCILPDFVPKPPKLASSADDRAARDAARKERIESKKRARETDEAETTTTTTTTVTTTAAEQQVQQQRPPPPIRRRSQQAPPAPLRRYGPASPTHHRRRRHMAASTALMAGPSDVDEGEDIDPRVDQEHGF